MNDPKFSSLYEKVESFVDGYNNWCVSIKEIQKLLDLDTQEYVRLRQYCFENGLLTSSRTGAQRLDPEYGWCRSFHRHYLARAKVYADAERFVKCIKYYNWDKSKEHIKTLIENYWFKRRFKYD